ncbi:cytochrome P450 [Amycolatopsis sp. FDAARGOS 1241]|uniref:cytochrome P450 n=1 Tax=Amycolatopsis sp. FDAARGOS 1241 TaxID=2778070 RepID=UPI001950DD4B|nr:cytochrome P450 [Amycolatopsis sp. FDAARGOS 1241]QRP45235.1 cytochrome P450 [Amycolatopsis sp. FDAARGOS 1241]
MTTMEELPVARKCPFAPPEEYTATREEAPIHRVKIPDGKQAWVVSRHEDVRAVLNDPRFSADRFNPDFPTLVPGGNVTRRTEAERTMLAMDAPQHGPERKAVLGEFTVKRVGELKPRIQEIVDGLIDDILASDQPVDLVETLSLPVPSLVICELLGVPYEDHEFFQENTKQLIKRATTAEARRAAFERVQSYLADLIATKETDPGDDLLGRQIVKRREEGTYDRAKLVSLAFLLLAAGHETTANMISLGTVAFLHNPDQLALIKADPAKTLPAVEELLRYFSIVDNTARLAKEDVEVGGVTIKAGEGVVLMAYAANWDPDVFADSAAFDIERGARHHVAFGFGPHQCLGQNLARTELQIVFDTLFRRIPTLKLAKEVEDLPFKDDALIYGLYELPVTW